jgi:cytochrome c551/c552
MRLSALLTTLAALLLVGCGASNGTAPRRSARSEPIPGVVFGGESAAVLHIEPAKGSESGAAQLAQFRRGRVIAAEMGCPACHEFGAQGQPGPGPQLTHIAGRLPPRAIARAIVHPVAPMPNQHLASAKLQALVAFLSALR